MKINKEILVALNETTLNEAIYGIDFSKTNLYKKLKNICKSISLEQFKRDDCLYVGPYERNQSYYSGFGIAKSVVNRAEKIIIQDCEAQFVDYIEENGGKVYVTCNFTEDGKFEVYIELTFNKGNGFPQFYFNVRYSKDKSKYNRVEFTNSSAGAFSDFNTFIKITDSIKAFCRDMLRK